MQSRVYLLMACFCMLFTLPLSGCGEDEEVMTRRPSARKGRKRRRKSKKSMGPAVLDTSRLPAKLRNVDWKAELSKERRRESRDPFVPFVDDLIVGVPTELDGPKTSTTLRPIDLYDVDELQLIAIITGTALHKAMVTDPTGLGHIVREGDVVGRGTPMRVQRITRNEVLFKPLKAPSEQDNQPKELRKVLLTQEELEELLP